MRRAVKPPDCDTCINHDGSYSEGRGAVTSWTRTECGMAEDLKNMPEVDLLPVWQRIAWMAAIWLFSVGAMALLSLAVRAFFS